MFDLDELSRWDMGFARLETACPARLRDLYREIMAIPAPKERAPAPRPEEARAA